MLLSAFSYIKDKTSYLQEFISDPRSTGTIAPSSRSLCKTMSGGVDWENVRSIAELGAGDGVLTRHLLKRMHADCSLSAFETNLHFYSKLSEIGDERLTVLIDSAENIEPGYDAIFSGLPLLSLPDDTRHHILQRARDALNPGGIFIQFQYTALSESLLSQYFNWTRARVICNIPPALVYRCHSV
ncbi:Phospholipid N-methyltransferase [Izhakiella capsodis]|uniref:Phospholipid N-methyltransferase n=1 Tax=Izhakiella capsodis TaxID=1367852 RepID=A0A1I4YJB5_9GAMM|nr:rRNA adenine N-6-methyltransferase family protein [Izhakiella capsodis]SFN38105.1 Phospholipid N-methyltransferase [Izhakiella capsodis]